MAGDNEDPIQAALARGRRDGQSAREKLAQSIEQKAEARAIDAAEAEKPADKKDIH